MTSAGPSHPRRRPASPSTTPSSLVDAFQSMSLRKGDTLHGPSALASDLFSPFDSARTGSPSKPLRSTTCPMSLEDLLIGAGERRAADLLARVDKAIATQSKLAVAGALTEPEVLPVPTFTVDQTNVPEEAGLKTRTRSQRHSHSSDSGIGSSVAASNESISGKSLTTDDNTKSAHDHSLSSIATATGERGLSEYAKLQINKHIVKPILREESLKEFHRLIRDVPQRIGNKEINTLRELERTLIFLAPEFSPSPAKYLDFCERTIRVLHTTVTTLHESDQRAPTDRPYTQGYFVDLVEQIRRYATILAATREKQEKGEELDDMDYSPDESVSLHGGVSHNGKPAELVRHKDGKLISIATGESLSPEDLASASMKRSMQDADVDSDEVLRSMARRKKNAKPEIHECYLCDKEFKRPCDLTKHIKTHERPWKCPRDDCKYHDLGWPTEKERDRHVNDKHSSAPSLYHCLFKPCPYTSKRESNCKQHMEKAHGWAYVRSKNNGKNRLSDMMRLPQTSMPPSPSSALLTPIAPSPSNQSWSTTSRRDSLAPPTAGPSNYGTPAFTNPSPDFSGHFNMDFDFNDISDVFASTSAFPMTPAMSDDRRTSSVASSSGIVLDGSTYNNAFSPEDLNLEAKYNFNPAPYQQLTPNSNIGPSSGNFAPASYNDFNMESAVASSSYVSPHANADVTLTSPYDNMEVGDDAISAEFAQPHEDFTLFNNVAEQPVTSASDMFPSLSERSGWENCGSQFDFNAPPAHFLSDNSALNELFPELTHNV